MQLYLNTFGTYLHVKDALFELRIPVDGQTTTHHFAAKKVTAIVMTVAGALSTDAVRLALQHNVDLIFADRSGFPLGRVWHSKLGSTTRIRKVQLAASLDQRGLDWTLRWISDKLSRQNELLERLKKHRKPQHEYIDGQRSRIEALRQSLLLLNENGQTVEEIAATLRGLEGTAGRLYFQVLNELLPETAKFAGRSFRPAADPFNAFLNYGYGILYTRVEKALMIAGLDPYVGFLHRDDYNQKSMVFDFIEPYRTWVDKVVFGLFSRKLVREEHTEPVNSGVSLAKEGKVLLIEKLNDYLEVEKITYRRRKLTRAHAMQFDAHGFANELLGKENVPLENISL